jgi:hypothetical protein
VTLGPGLYPSLDRRRSLALILRLSDNHERE